MNNRTKIKMINKKSNKNKKNNKNRIKTNKNEVQYVKNR